MTELVESPEEDTELVEGDEERPRGFGAKIASALIVLFALGAGGVVGMTTLGPSLGPVLAERAQSAGSGEGHGEGASPVHVIDNLVVNPARSAGTRFLLASIAVEANTPEQAAIIAEHDIELRDALILVLGAKSVEELTDISQRAGIVRQVKASISKILGPELIHEIYIPQFVIQ
jgi:flagellar protein FliL